VKATFFFACFLFFSSATFSQVNLEELKSFTNDVCKCIDSFEDSNLKGCVLLFKGEKKHSTIVDELSKSKYNVNSEIMKMVQFSLVNKCDAYGDFILREAGMDLDAPFDPTMKKIGVSLCEDVSKLKTLSDKEIDEVIIQFCKREEKKLIQIYETPKKAMREVMRFALVNCPKYKRYIVMQSLVQN